MNTPLYVYDCVARLAGQSCHYFRHCAIRAATVTAAYIQRDVWEVLYSPPLSLCRGDVEENVRRLAETDRDDIDEPVSRQLRDLMDNDVPQSHVQDALRLLAESPCSTTLVEQGHGSAAQIVRHHSSYGEAAIRGCLGGLWFDALLDRSSTDSRTICAWHNVDI